MSSDELFGDRWKRLLEVAEKGEDAYFQKYFDILNEYEVHPADLVQFENAVLYDFKLRRALEKDLTIRWNQVIARANRPEKNLIIQLIGKTDRGKSTLSAMITHSFYVEHPDILIKVVYNESEGKNSIPYLNQVAHSTLVNDEDLDLSGKGSRTESKAFKNLKKMCRQFALNLIFNAKEFTKQINIDVYLYILGFNEKTGITRCLWLDDKGDPLGLVYLKKEFDAEFYKPWEENKVAKWQHMMKTLGMESVLNEEQADMLKERIIDEMHQKNQIIDKKSDIEDFLLTYHTEINPNVVKQLAGICWGNLRFKRQQQCKQASGEHDPKRFRESDYLIISETKYSSVFEGNIRRLQLGEDERFVFEEMLNLNQNNYSYDDIIRQLRIKIYAGVPRDHQKFKSKSLISKFKSELQDGELGIAFEKEDAKILRSKYKDVVIGGGHTDEPDKIIHYKKAVISEKCVVFDADRKNYFSKVGIQEISFAEFHKYALYLRIFVMETQTLYCYRNKHFLREEEEKKQEESEDGSGK